MFNLFNNNKQDDYNTIGKGFARTEGSNILSEDYALPYGPGKGFAKVDFGNGFSLPKLTLRTKSFNTIGKGFARMENCDIVAEDYAIPQGAGKGYAKVDFGNILHYSTLAYQ